MDPDVKKEETPLAEQPVADAAEVPPVKREASVPIESNGATPKPESAPKRQKVSEEPELPGGPAYEIVGGSTVRQYLNKHLTKHLLEGLKQVGNEKPDDPLKWLGEFLIERSKVVDK